MSVYGYTHAPIGNNDFQVQHFAILSFASNNRLGQVHFCNEIPDQLHGAKPILSGMIQTLQREEVLIVSDFLKLGSSTDEVLGVLSTLSRIGVKLYAVDSGFRLEDNMDAQVISMAYSLVSRIEQELFGNAKSTAVIQKPTKDEDRDVKPIRTRKSKLNGKEDQIRSLISNGVSLAEMSRQLNVSRPALTDFIRTRGVSV